MRYIAFGSGSEKGDAQRVTWRPSQSYPATQKDICWTLSRWQWSAHICRSKYIEHRQMAGKEGEKIETNEDDDDENKDGFWAGQIGHFSF